MVSAETLLVPPDADMLLAHIVCEGAAIDQGTPRVVCDDAASLPLRISSAIDRARETVQEGLPLRIVIEVAGAAEGADEARRDQVAHHDAITLLDAFCAAFS